MKSEFALAVRYCRGGVRFVVFWMLLLNTQALVAQWDSDPANHRVYDWPASENSSLCTDNQGGAFFSLAPGGGSLFFIGHMDADGYQTMPSNTPWYEQLTVFDSTIYWSWPITLIPSEPAGTVIAMGFRIQGSIPRGLVFIKYGTTGEIGFGRVFVNDSTLRPYGDDPNSSGYDCARSDGNGGLHLLVLTYPPSQYYYNHLSSTGQWRYAWPGYGLPNIGSLSEDGYGSVFVWWPTQSGERWAQLFDHEGNWRWEDGGRMMVPAGFWGMTTDLLEPGITLGATDTSLGNNTYGHRLFLFDTSGTNLWEARGRPFAVSDSQQFSSWRLIADQEGGFFFNRVITPPAVDLVERYDGNAILIASSADSEWINFADGVGGGFRRSFEPFVDPERILIRRYTPDLTLTWPNPTMALQTTWEIHQPSFIVTSDQRVIGMTLFGPGVMFYNVNPDGNLGPRLGVSPETHAPLPHWELTTYPNPFNSALVISLERFGVALARFVVHDVLGRTVAQSPDLSSPTMKWIWNADHMASGTYYISILQPHQSILSPATKQVILIR